MQTSELTTAYQTISAGAYQRLRETLLRQAHLFSTVDEGDTFILMRSTTLSVLLSAEKLSEESFYPGHLQSTEDLDSDYRLAVNRLSTQAQYDSSNASVNSFDLDSPMYEKTSLAEDDKRTDSQSKSERYKVSLTFDEEAIASFAEEKGIAPQTTSQTELQAESTQADSAHTNHSPTPQNVADSDVAKRDSFVLSWAKDLCQSPEGDIQPTQSKLDAQLQQSLLLDQVITRIRHSLDLPAILETTVAQVREFLSADRLVLYQFDELDLEDEIPQPLDSREMPASTESDESEQATVTSSSLVPENARTHHHPRVGRSVFSGHVTYESRISEDIPTVLYHSEEKCFTTSHSQRHLQYLRGRPITINNINETYKDVECLLDFLNSVSVKSKIIAPIIVQDRLWGLLIVHQCNSYRQWKESEAIFLQHIAEHLAVAISQASLYQQLRQQATTLESCVAERTQSLHDALIAAESANITKDEFLSTMSHELRTPLTYIIGMSATLLRWSLGNLNERQRSYLRTINQSGEHLLKVINDILEFASVESGRSLLDANVISLSSFIDQVVGSHQAMAENQHISLRLLFEVPSEEDWLEADAKRLQQIIDNLIHNAIKFTGAGGRVDVRVWKEPDAVVFQVADTGIGIPESQRDALFERFKQLESPFQRQYPGTGLGLAMTKRLTELHGGTIEVDSQVADGSTFTVRLPISKDLSEALARKPQSLEKILETNPKRIILLEKDEDNAAIACEMLMAAEYEVIWLVEYEHLAQQLGLLKPALLIADLSLIEHNSSSIKAIQHTLTAFNTKVIAISSAQSLDNSVMAHHDILNKPIDPKALLGKVQQLL